MTSSYRTRREALGLTLAQLAAVAGVSERWLRNLEAGAPVTPAYLARVENALQAAEAERAGVARAGTVDARLTAAEQRLDAMERTVAAAHATIAELVAELRQQRRATPPPRRPAR